MITVRVAKDDVTPSLKKLMRTVRPDGALGKVLGRAASEELRKFYRELNTKRPNKLGGKRSHFYSRVAEAVQQGQPYAGGIKVRISHPHLALRLYGGTITPRKSKSLAVPAHSSAVGYYARIYPGTLAFIPLRRGNTKGVLVEGEEVTITRGKNKGGKRKRPKPGGALIYVLMGAVKQSKDPSVLPQGSRMGNALTKAARLVRPDRL